MVTRVVRGEFLEPFLCVCVLHPPCWPLVFLLLSTCFSIPSELDLKSLSSSSSPCSSSTPFPATLCPHFTFTSVRPTIKGSRPPALRFNSITALIRHHINRFTASKCRWPRPPCRLRPRSDPWDFVLRGMTRPGNVWQSRVGVRFLPSNNSNPAESDGDIFHQRKSDRNGNCLPFFLCHLAHLPTPNPASQHASGPSLANSPQRFEVLASAVVFFLRSICVALTCNLRYASRHLDIIGLLFSYLF